MGYAPLLRALTNGNSDIVRLLLDYNADVHARTNKGRILMHFAASHENLEAAKMLLEHNVEADSQDEHETTPLLVSELRLPGAVQLLLDHKADMYMPDGDGDTALHWYSAEGSLRLSSYYPTPMRRLILGITNDRHASRTNSEALAEPRCGYAGVQLLRNNCVRQYQTLALSKCCRISGQDGAYLSSTREFV